MNVESCPDSLPDNLRAQFHFDADLKPISYKANLLKRVKDRGTQKSMTEAEKKDLLLILKVSTDLLNCAKERPTDGKRGV